MEFSRYTSDLASSPLQKDQRECQSLHNEWQLARCRMWAELVAKFSHFQQLPYKILQLAHHDQSKVIIGAQACLWLWAQGGAGCHHRQSRRFLDPTWKSTAQDPSLLPLVKRLACGEDVLSSPDFAPLVHWLARFQCIRLAERTVEGVHSLMTRTLKRAPHADIPYLSVELRFEGFWQVMCKDPAVTDLDFRNNFFGTRIYVQLCAAITD